MPLTAGAQAAITGAAEIGQGIMGQLFAKRNVKMQMAANKELGRYTNQMNIENWKAENAYNTPAAQMQRYKDAGLNPNLIYDKGTSGNAGSIPQYQQPQTDVSLPVPQTLSHMGGILSNYQDTKLKQAQTDNVNQNTQNAVTRNAQELLNLAFDKEFGWQKRLYENRNLGQQYTIGEQKLNIGAQDLAQQIMKTNQTKLLLPYQNTALMAEYAVKARAMEKYNLDLSLLNQQKEVNKARIDLMNSEKQVKLAGLPNIMWDNALKAQEWSQNKQLFPVTKETKEREYRWMPWKNIATIGGSAIGAGVGAYGALKGGKYPTKPMGYTVKY
jgi:hypothetical protein